MTSKRPSTEGLLPADKDVLDNSFLERPMRTHLFKTPLRLRDLAAQKKVIFEFDGDQEADEFLEDDEAEDYNEEEEEKPVTETDPRKYMSSRRRKAVLEGINTTCDLSFLSFYDHEWVQEMEPIEEGGGVKKTILVEGSGPKVSENCKVFVHYAMAAEGEDDPFDSTLIRGYPQCIDLRINTALPGVSIAVKTMRIREVAKVLMTPEFAFGSIGCAPRIPGDAKVFMLIEVLDVIEENQLKLVPYMNTDERAELEFQPIYAAAKELRDIGNYEYNIKAFWRAVKRYRQAVNILEEYPTADQDDQDQRQNFLYTLYMNLSACYVRLERWAQVCVAVKCAFRCFDSQNEAHIHDKSEKLYFRFAKAKLMLGDAEQALQLNSVAIKLAPKDGLVREQRRQIKEAIEEDNLSRKMLYCKIGQSFCNGSSESDTRKEADEPSTSGHGSKKPEESPKDED